jgi:hypothetical protein
MMMMKQWKKSSHNIIKRNKQKLFFRNFTILSLSYFFGAEKLLNNSNRPKPKNSYDKKS